jgi:hypothetical protein
MEAGPLNRHRGRDGPTESSASSVLRSTGIEVAMEAGIGANDALRWWETKPSPTLPISTFLKSQLVFFSFYSTFLLAASYKTIRVSGSRSKESWDDDPVNEKELGR